MVTAQIQRPFIVWFSICVPKMVRFPNEEVLLLVQKNHTAFARLFGFLYLNYSIMVNKGFFGVAPYTPTRFILVNVSALMFPHCSNGEVFFEMAFSLLQVHFFVFCTVHFIVAINVFGNFRNITNY